MRKDPVWLAEYRRKTAAAQRKRRAERGDVVREYDRKRHAANRAVRLAGFREHYAKGVTSGEGYVRRYGVPFEDARYALDHRPDMCPICRRDRPLVFDHDNEAGRFRGWLCRTCNAGLGQFGDTIDGVRRALAYMEAYVERTSQKI